MSQISSRYPWISLCFSCNLMSQISLVLPLLLMLCDVTDLPGSPSVSRAIGCHKSPPDLLSQISQGLPLFLVLSAVTDLLQICGHRSPPDLMSQISLDLPLFLMLSAVTDLLQICCHRSPPDLMSQISLGLPVFPVLLQLPYLLGRPCASLVSRAHISSRGPHLLSPLTPLFRLVPPELTSVQHR